MRIIAAGFVSLVLGDAGIAWWVVHDLQGVKYLSPDASIQTLEVCGTSAMEILIGYDRIKNFSSIVTHQEPAGSVNHSAHGKLANLMYRHSRIVQYPSHRSCGVIKPVTMRRSLENNTPEINLSEKENEFFNLYPAMDSCGQTQSFKNNLDFTDRMYNSENTRNRQPNKQVRSADRSSEISEFFHSLWAFPRHNIASRAFHA